MKRAEIIAVVVLLAGCGAEETEQVEITHAAEPATMEVGLPAEMVIPAPAYGGTVVLAGQRPIELVADREGTIDAYYVGSAPPAPQDAQLTVRVPDAEGVVRPVVLTWDPAEAHYRGRLRGAHPVPGPIEVLFVLGGETLRARAPTFVLVEPAVRLAVRARPVPVEPPGGPAIVYANEPAPPGIRVITAEPPPPPIVIARPPGPPPPPVVVVTPGAPPPPQIVIAAPPPPQPTRVVIAAPPPPQPARVVIAAPPSPQPARVVIAAPPPPQPARVVVAAPPPPQPARVVVAAPPPPQPARVVVAAPPQPPPPPRVVVVRERDDDDDDDDDRRGRARGHDDDHPGRGHGNARGRGDRD